MTTYTQVKKEDLSKLQEHGFWFDDIKTKYEVARMKSKRVILILFTTGKLLIQGKEEGVKQVEDTLEGLKIGRKVKPIEFVKEHGDVIGSDEALKGDTFGGIVVAAVKADDKTRHDLMFAGVMDSKKLKDNEIEVVAERIKKVAKYKVISLMPTEYNKYESQTFLLNKLHNDAISALGSSGLIVVDKYPGCKVKAKCETKAESKYVEVAAASILARDAGLKQLKKLSESYGIELPKGSTHVDDALKESVKRRIDLRKIAKVSFGNVRKYLV